MSTFDRLVAALADRYRFERELGRGGMATVYLAEALKHYRAAHETDTRVRELSRLSQGSC